MSLPWKLIRCTNSVAESCHDNGLTASGKRASRKGVSPRKRSRDAETKNRPKWRAGTKSIKKLTQTGVAFSEISVGYRKLRRKNMEVCFSWKNCFHELCLASNC